MSNPPVKKKSHIIWHLACYLILAIVTLVNVTTFVMQYRIMQINKALIALSQPAMEYATVYQKQHPVKVSDKH